MTSAQTWNAADYNTHASFVAALGTPVLDLLTVPPPARVLDLGCGDGVLTRALADRGYDVLGIDASAAMVRAAEARGVHAACVDAHASPYEEAFDAVFSNAALHWCTRPDEVLRGVYRALRRGGEFAGEFGGRGNVAQVVRALVAGLDARGVEGSAQVPWYFPSAGEYATRLEQAGFHVDFIAHFARPTPLPTDVRGWIGTFGESFTRSLPSEDRAAYLEEVQASLADELSDGHGAWTLDYVRLRFRATKR